MTKPTNSKVGVRNLSFQLIKVVKMKNTLPNVLLKVGVWTNLYTEISAVNGSPVPVGTPIRISVLEPGIVFLNVGPSQPTSASGYEPVRGFEYAENETGDSGFWAYAPFTDILVNLREL